jgi:hypothetical protein
VVFVPDEESFCCAVDDQGFRPFLRAWMQWIASSILRRCRGRGVVR